MYLCLFGSIFLLFPLLFSQSFLFGATASLTPMSRMRKGPEEGELLSQRTDIRERSIMRVEAESGIDVSF